MNQDEKAPNEFDIMPQELHFDEPVNFMEDNQDMKLDNIPFSLSKAPKERDGFKLDLNDEVDLQLDHNPGSLMDSLLPN